MVSSQKKSSNSKLWVVTSDSTVFYAYAATVFDNRLVHRILDTSKLEQPHASMFPQPKEYYVYELNLNNYSYNHLFVTTFRCIFEKNRTWSSSFLMIIRYSERFFPQGEGVEMFWQFTSSFQTCLEPLVFGGIISKGTHMIV